MSRRVGDKLKELYAREEYRQVDTKSIRMTTKNMGSGTVIYYLSIPFLEVAQPCDAYTSFDHVGGWNHTPTLEARKKQLSPLVIDGQSLYVSELKITPEGLQEYWIQWKHKEIQHTCK